MIKIVSIGLFLLSVGCATSAPKMTYSDLSDQVSAFLSEREFTEARATIRGRGSMCKGYNSNGFCYAGEVNDAEARLGALIDRAQNCDNTIEQIRTQNITPVGANKLKLQLNVACSNVDSSPEDRAALPLSFDQRVKDANAKLATIAPPPKPENFADGTLNPVAIAENRCKAGMRWGYLVWQSRGKTQEVFNPASGQVTEIRLEPQKDKVVYKGAFETADKCAEMRLTDPDAILEGTYLLNLCQERYAGDSVQVTIAEIDVMGGANEFSTKSTVYFSSLEKCEMARIKGYENQGIESQVGDPKRIDPLGSDTRPRFIGDCKILQKIICDSNSGIHSVRLLK